MPPEDKALLEKSFELEKENNLMLRSIKRSMRFSSIMSLLYWVFIIGSAIGAYYLIQPYIESLTGAYGGAQNSFSGGLGSIKSTIDSFKQLTQ